MNLKICDRDACAHNKGEGPEGLERVPGWAQFVVNGLTEMKPLGPSRGMYGGLVVTNGPPIA